MNEHQGNCVDPIHLDRRGCGGGHLEFGVFHIAFRPGAGDGSIRVGWMAIQSPSYAVRRELYRFDPSVSDQASVNLAERLGRGSSRWGLQVSWDLAGPPSPAHEGAESKQRQCARAWNNSKSTVEHHRCAAIEREGKVDCECVASRPHKASTAGVHRIV